MNINKSVTEAHAFSTMNFIMHIHIPNHQRINKQLQVYKGSEDDNTSSSQKITNVKMSLPHE